MLKASDRDLEIPPIRIDIDALLADIERQQERRLRFRQLFAEHRSISMSYEALLSNPQTEHKRLTDFLGVGQRSLSPGTRRNIRRPLREAIDNFDEVCAALRGTDLERFCESC
jgi:hypothetical protein